MVIHVITRNTEVRPFYCNILCNCVMCVGLPLTWWNEVI